METVKRYYDDSHLREFDARVLTCRREGERWLVTLDQTAFYPEGGGQAGDTGTIGSVRVLDTQEHGEEVVHFCDGALEPGAVVHGVIDYERRFDLMQQHTGEHILSGLIHEKYGYHNTGFHMGADVVTVDFDGIVPPEDLPELERKANEAVFRDIPLECWVPSEQELPTVTYRTKRALPWPVRIVRVPGYDSCACCGVHVQRTGEIGVIKLLSVVRFRTGVRMEMVCGGRALALLNESYRQNQIVSRAFSAKPSETGEAARRMNETVDSLKLELAQLRRQIFAAKADRCRDAGNVLLFEPDLEPADVRRLADLTAQVCGGVAAVLSGDDSRGYAYCLVSRSADLRPLGKALNQSLSGRGGGRAEFQQGSLQAERTRIMDFFSGYRCL